jgi:hypothetical protein
MNLSLIIVRYNVCFIDVFNFNLIVTQDTSDLIDIKGARVELDNDFIIINIINDLSLF